MAIASEGSLATKAKYVEIGSSLLGVFNFAPLIGPTLVMIAQVSGSEPGLR